MYELLRHRRCVEHCEFCESSHQRNDRPSLELLGEETGGAIECQLALATGSVNGVATYEPILNIRSYHLGELFIRRKPNRRYNAGICLSRFHIDTQKTVTPTEGAAPRSITVACTTRATWYVEPQPNESECHEPGLHMKFRLTLEPVESSNNIRKPDSSKENYAYLYHNSKTWLPNLRIWRCSPETPAKHEHFFARILCALAQAAGFYAQASGPAISRGCTCLTEDTFCETHFLFSACGDCELEYKLVDEHTLEFDIWSLSFPGMPNDGIFGYASIAFDEF
jgi:hypothetical protein